MAATLLGGCVLISSDERSARQEAAGGGCAETESACDGVDEDCDGAVDEGVGELYYADGDDDGYPAAGEGLAACDQPAGYAADPGEGGDWDCDDAEASINPGAAEDCDGADQDCDDAIDEGATGTFYTDADGDGYGDPTTGTDDCASSGVVSDGTDCDDADPDAWPGAEEICDGADSDCDGGVDEGAPDVDGDGVADCLDDCPVYTDPAARGDGDGSEASPHVSIEEAIALRGAFCDEVVLLPGTYPGGLDFGGEVVSVISRDGPEVTILDAGGVGPAAGFQSGEPPEAVLEGVTLTGGGGAQSGGETHGGGLYISGASPTVRGCIIEDNRATGYGGGALLREFSGVFEENVVRENSGALGGGIALIDSAGAVRGAMIEDNTAESGGGLYAEGDASTVEANWLARNTADEGAGVRLLASSTSLLNSLITDHSGYAIQVSDLDNSAILHNTLDGNEYGIYAFPGTLGSPETTVINNNITRSEIYGAWLASYTGLTWSSNNVWNAGEGLYILGGSSLNSYSSDLQVDPEYNSITSYRLSSTSPVRDAGDDLTHVVPVDYDGAARPEGDGVSIGAFER